MDYTKRYILIGFGLSGKSTYNYLKKHNADIIKIIDTRDAFVFDNIAEPTQSGEFDYNQVKMADVIVLSPGVSIYHPALQEAIFHGIKVIGDIEIFAQEMVKYNTQLIGITGSNGKTTVTTLCDYILNNLGYSSMALGNIGNPVLTELDLLEEGVKAIPDFIVLELSSFQLETTYSLSLNSATCLNISEDHMDRYRDLLEYAYVKSNIFTHSKVQVLNADDVICAAMQRDLQSCCYFGRSSEYGLSYINKQIFLNTPNYPLINTASCGLVGVHNYFNILAAIALIQGCGIMLTEQMVGIIQSFQGLEHRVQKIALHNDVTYIEDSKGTNVGAVIAAIEGMNNPIHLLLGGDGKGQDFTPLIPAIAKHCSSVAIIGQDKHLIGQMVQRSGVNYQIFESFQEAVLFLCNNARPHDIVLLSPACASWDMFSDYKERAKIFKEIVDEYIQQK